MNPKLEKFASSMTDVVITAVENGIPTPVIAAATIKWLTMALVAETGNDTKKVRDVLFLSVEFALADVQRPDQKVIKKILKTVPKK